MAPEPQRGVRTWLAVLAGVVAVATAVFGAVAAYHNIRKSREDADRAQAEKEKAQAEAKKAQGDDKPINPVPPPAEPVRPPQPKAEPVPPKPAPPVAAGEGVADFKADPRFGKYLLANPLLLDVSGVKIIQLKDGNRAVFSVAVTELADDSAAERIRAEKVCRIKATTSLLKSKQDAQIAHAETLKGGGLDVKLAAGGKSPEEILDLTTEKIEGLVREMPPVARWRSADGKRFFLATGQIVNGRGEVVPVDE